MHCYQHCLCNHAYLSLSVHPCYPLYMYLHFGLNLPTHVCYVHAGAWLICYVHALPLHASTTCYVSIYGKYSRTTLVHNPQGSTPLRSVSQLGHQIIVLQCIEHSQYGITSLECHPKGSLQAAHTTEWWVCSCMHDNVCGMQCCRLIILKRIKITCFRDSSRHCERALRLMPRRRYTCTICTFVLHVPG